MGSRGCRRSARSQSAESAARCREAHSSTSAIALREIEPARTSRSGPPEARGTAARDEPERSGTRTLTRGPASVTPPTRSGDEDPLEEERRDPEDEEDRPERHVAAARGARVALHRGVVGAAEPGGQLRRLEPARVRLSRIRRDRERVARLEPLLPAGLDLHL